MKAKAYFIVILILAFIGFADATYLTAIHYMDAPPGCGESGGCGEVAASEYSTLFGLPVALYGIFFYITVIFLSLLWLDRRTAFVTKALPIISAPAVLFSAWLVYLMLFVIEAICWFCVGSATSSTLIFITSVALWLKTKGSA